MGNTSRGSYDYAFSLAVYSSPYRGFQISTLRPSTRNQKRHTVAYQLTNFAQLPRICATHDQAAVSFLIPFFCYLLGKILVEWFRIRPVSRIRGMYLKVLEFSCFGIGCMTNDKDAFICAHEKRFKRVGAREAIDGYRVYPHFIKRILRPSVVGVANSSRELPI